MLKFPKKSRFAYPATRQDIFYHNRKLAIRMWHNLADLFSIHKSLLLIGITGGVGSGKSSLAMVLKKEIQIRTRYKVHLISTDSFIYDNKYLYKNGLFDRKGFPESYDWQKFQSFIQGIKNGIHYKYSLHTYSQESKDIDKSKLINFDIKLNRKTVIIFEGINLLFDYQKSYDQNPFMPLTLMDKSFYIDINEQKMKSRTIKRFLATYKKAKFSKFPPEYFKPILKYSDAQLSQYINLIWNNINLQLLNEYIIPAKSKADIVLYSSR